MWEDELTELSSTGACRMEGSSAELVELASRLGSPVAARRSGPLLDRLVPKATGEAAPRSLSAAYGFGRFPFHTDAAHHRSPPRFVLLRCASCTPTGVPTLVADFDGMQFTPSELKTLKREQWVVRGGRGRTFYAPLLDEIDGRRRIRWDPGCMSPVAGTTPVGQEIVAGALRSADATEIRWHEGEVTILDNWRMLHARPAVSRDDELRVLERIMVA